MPPNGSGNRTPLEAIGGLVMSIDKCTGTERLATRSHGRIHRPGASLEAMHGLIAFTLNRRHAVVIIDVCIDYDKV
jgi:hypothetical protein